MREYILELRQLEPGVKRFVATESLLGIATGLFSLVLNLHLLALGVGEDKIGEITSMGNLIMGTIALPSAMLAGYTGRKPLLVIGLVMMAFGYMLFGWGGSLPVFYAAQAVLSIGTTFLVTTEIQLLFQYSSSGKGETQAYSLVFAIFTLFTGAGTLLGGWLPGWLPSGSTSYQGTLYAATGFLLLCALARGLLLPKEMKVKPVETKSTKHKRTSWIPSKQVVLSAAFVFTLGLSMGYINPFLNIIVKFRFDWPDYWVSILLTANGVILFISSLIMPPILEKLGTFKTMVLAHAVNIVVALVLSVALPVPVAGLMLLLRGGSYIFLVNLIESKTMSAIAEEERDIFSGLRSVFRSIGFSVSTYSAGVILSHKNYVLPFFITSILIILTFGYYWLFMRPYMTNEPEKSIE